MRRDVFTRFRAPWSAVALMLCARAFAVVQPQGPAEAGFPLLGAYSSHEIGADGMGWVGLQAPDGRLLFGTHSLLVFDAEQWRSFPVGGSYALRALDLGHRGRIWAGALGEVGWFEPAGSGWAYRSLRNHLPAEHAVLGDVWHVFAEGDQGAVFVSEDRILRWDGSAFQVWVMPGGRHLRGLRTGGEIFVQDLLTGLYAMTPAGPTRVLTAAQLGDTSIFWIQREGDALLLVTSQGLFRLQGGELRPVQGTATEFILAHPLTTVVGMNHGRLAVGTINHGLAIITPAGDLVSELGEDAGLTRFVAPLLFDREGALWASSSATLFRVPLHSPSTLFDIRAQFKGQPPAKIARHPDGRLLLANRQGLYTLTPALRTITSVPLTQGPINDFHVTAAGVLTAGHHALSHVSADLGSMTVIHSTKSDVLVVQPSRQDPSRHYIADGRKIIALNADGTSTLLAGDLPDIANSIAEDAAQNVWVGTNAYGVFRLPRDGSAMLQRREPVRDASFNNAAGLARVVAMEGGTIVVFNSAGAWVRRSGGEGFRHVGSFPARKTAALSQSTDGRAALWVVFAPERERGSTVGRLELGGKDPIWEPHAAEGLGDVGIPSAIFAEVAPASTVLWIGGNRGVLRHEINGGLSAPVPLAPVVRAFVRARVDGPLAAVSGPLPYSIRSIEFEFAAPEFSARRALRLETRIDGIDSGWVTATRESRRELTAVRDGTYTFQARAVAVTGVPSPVTQVTFQVLPPWWRTGRSAAGLGIILVVVAYGGFRLRIRTLRRRNAYLEQKVRQRTDELERASAAKTEFVANMSHDIRNPLNGIVGLALALEDTRLDPKQREIVATLRECTTYLSTLVDDVLDFASIEAGKVELRPGRFAAADLLQSIVTTLKTDTAECGASLSVGIDPSLPDYLVGDAGRIQQILINYVSNALKYAGGHIRLSVSQPATSPGEVEFAVTDDGPGLSAADQALLFTKFSRTPSARRQEIPGTGLGLASCRMLADLMGGSVSVTSSPDAGARFCLRLPLTVATEPAEIDTAALPNTTVLLVEDTDYNAWAATAVLSKLGLSCQRARTGREALRLFGEKRFNVVLLDRNLPDMDGTDVARQMRAMESEGPQAVLLAVTAYCTAGDRKVCLESGMDAFVGKPLTPEKLRRVLIAAGRRLLAAASVHVSPDLPAAEVDLSLLTYLADGKTEGLEEQIERFLDTLAETERELASAAALRKYEVIRIAAHRLLGQARMVGGTALAAAAERLEAAALAEDERACGEFARSVDAEIRALTEAMRHRRAGQSA